jgi:hypothetical protein
MRLFIFIIAFIFAGATIKAQEFKADISYKYMFANQWDKAIQTYNFSRPFLIDKQPLLMNGLNASVSCVFKSPKKVKHGINLSYSYFRSLSENDNLENKLKLHFLNLGYVLHYEKTGKLEGLYIDFIISITSSALYRRVNGEAFKYDDTKSKAFGIGGDIGLKFGYYVKLKKKYYLSPFIALGYTPYLYSPNTEAVINQTKGLLEKNWTGVLTTQIGISFHLRKQVND